MIIITISKGNSNNDSTTNNNCDLSNSNDFYDNNDVIQRVIKTLRKRNSQDTQNK